MIYVILPSDIAAWQLDDALEAPMVATSSSTGASEYAMERASYTKRNYSVFKLVEVAFYKGVR